MTQRILLLSPLTGRAQQSLIRLIPKHAVSIPTCISATVAFHKQNAYNTERNVRRKLWQEAVSAQRPASNKDGAIFHSR